MPDKRDDLLERGLQLAYFIVPNRALAIQILTGAMNKLKAQVGREKKRAYWRDKYLKRWITSISRGDADALQWLIYLESEACERERELSGDISTRDLIVCYIKHLVRLTTAMSSFHVSVGVSRVLHRYETPSTQRMYEFVSERYLGADQFRRAKRLLMDKLAARFSGLLKTMRSGHGEAQFETLKDQRHWAGLARECLTAFTPWSTKKACVVSDGALRSRGNLINWPEASVQNKVHCDAIEINRCHIFIDPICFERLTTTLWFDPPERRLALPQFFMNSKTDEQDKGEVHSANHPLTSEERKKIGNNLSEEAGRRRQLSPQSLRILVDGTERAHLDLREECECRFQTSEGEKLVEIWTRDDEGDFLLTTHFIPYNNDQGFAPSQITVPLKQAGNLVLAFAPQMQADDEARRATVSARYTRTPSSPAWAAAGEFLAHRPGLAATYVLAGIALTVAGWVFAGAKYRRDLASQQIALQQAREQLDAEGKRAPLGSNEEAARVPEEPASYRLVPDDLATRGQGGMDTSIVSVPTVPALIGLELPAGNTVHHSYRAVLKPFLGANEILSEDMLSPTGTASGQAIKFTFASSLLKPDNDYAVVLSWVNQAGKMEEVSSFTFHTVKRETANAPRK